MTVEEGRIRIGASPEPITPKPSARPCPNAAYTQEQAKPADGTDQIEGGGVQSMTADEQPRRCPFCGSEQTGLQRHGTIFARQDYGDRYPRKVATQPHGFRVRCDMCGCQTCWWHYPGEAVQAWNARHGLIDQTHNAYTQDHAKAAYDCLKRYGTSHDNQDLVHAQVEINRAVWAMNQESDEQFRRASHE